jgi:hypothetical protein
MSNYYQQYLGGGAVVTNNGLNQPSAIALRNTYSSTTQTRLDFFNSNISSGTAWSMINDNAANGTNDLRILSNAGGTTVMTLLQNGNVGIGTTNPVSPLTINPVTLPSSTYNINKYPPLLPPTKVSLTSSTYTGTVSGQAYGNGTYTYSTIYTYAWTSNGNTALSSLLTNSPNLTYNWQVSQTGIGFNEYNTSSPYNYVGVSGALIQTYSSSTLQNYNGLWLQIQVPYAITLTSIVIATQNATSSIGNVIILSSLDGTNWVYQTTITTAMASTWVSGVSQTINVSTGGSYTYFRFVVTSLSGNYGSLLILQFYIQGYESSTPNSLININAPSSNGCTIQINGNSGNNTNGILICNGGSGAWQSNPYRAWIGLKGGLNASPDNALQFYNDSPSLKPTDTAFSFYTYINGLSSITPCLFITGSGNVGIGTATPSTTFEVWSSGTKVVSFSSTIGLNIGGTMNILFPNSSSLTTAGINIFFASHLSMTAYGLLLNAGATDGSQDSTGTTGNDLILNVSKSAKKVKIQVASYDIGTFSSSGLRINNPSDAYSAGSILSTNGMITVLPTGLDGVRPMSLALRQYGNLGAFTYLYMNNYTTNNQCYFIIDIFNGGGHKDIATFSQSGLTLDGILNATSYVTSPFLVANSTTTVGQVKLGVSQTSTTSGNIDFLGPAPSYTSYGSIYGSTSGMTINALGYQIATFSSGGTAIYVPAGGGNLQSSSTPVVGLTGNGLGVGTASPTRALDVRGDAIIIGDLTANGTSAAFRFALNNTANIGGQYMALTGFSNSGGGVQFNMGSSVVGNGNTAIFNMYANGDTFAFGNLSVGSLSNRGSDERIKMNIVPYTTPTLDLLNNIVVSNFSYKKQPNKKSIGFIAQNIQKYIPELVIPAKMVNELNDFELTEDDVKDNPILTIKTVDGMIPYLVKAMQEQHALFVEQNKMLVELSQQVKILQQQVINLQSNN